MTVCMIKHYVTSVLWMMWMRQLRLRSFSMNLATFQTLSMQYTKSKGSELVMKTRQTQRSDGVFGEVIKNNGGREREHKRGDDLLLFPRGAPNLSRRHSVPEMRWDGISPSYIWDSESLPAHWFWNQTVATANQGNKTARISAAQLKCSVQLTL